MIDNGAVPGRSARRHPGGLTWVEVLVVIAIIGILMALLIPAVSTPRGPARRNQCSTHLKNLSLAAIQHADVKQRLPAWADRFGHFAGGIDPTAGSGHPPCPPHHKVGTWAVNLLPWLDAQPTYEHWTEDRYPLWTSANASEGSAWSPNAAPNLAIMQCYSSDRDAAALGRNDYVINTGLAIEPGDASLVGGVLTDAFSRSLQPDQTPINLAGAEFVFADQPVPAGPIFGLEDFRDGLGVTVLFTESLTAGPYHLAGFAPRGDWFTDDPEAPVSYPVGSRYSTALARLEPTLTFSARLKNSKNATARTAGKAAMMAFPSSNHVDGFNTAMADGGTRYITDTIDPVVWDALMTPAGREKITEKDF